MRRVTPVIGFALGALVGVGAMMATAHLDAGQAARATQRPGARFIEIQAPRGQVRVEGFGSDERFIQPPPGLVFFKDVNSDGCWLTALGGGNGNEVVALAVAPTAACQ